jgi:DNA (cytosine-5)-methyltransferase 1
MARPSFYEFFCGGGMARAGLEPAWQALFANDFDARKGAAYAANWGAQELKISDVAALTERDLPGEADLAWASFPCQDLSLAGAGAGLDGKRSGAFWGFCAVMERLKSEGRAPKLVALENVFGTLTSKGGADFAAIAAALQSLDYRFGALTIDAALFLPQSRPRVFFVAVRSDVPVPPRFASTSQPDHHVSSALKRAAAALPPALAADWIWWRLPEAPRGNARLVDCLEPNPQRWREPSETAALVAALSPASKRDVALAQESGARHVGALFRRTRPDGAGGVRVQAEARFDGFAGCLRTPGGGSSRQFLIEVEGASIRTRLMTPREAARLMGLPDSFKLPSRATDALHLVGDGVAPPVVRFLSENLLLPLAEAEARAPFGAARRARSA